MRPRRGLLGIVALLVACGPDVSTVIGDSDSSGTSGSRSDSSQEADSTAIAETADVTDDTSPDDGTADSTGPAAGCGNGVVDPGEACDDDSAECRDDCQLACTLAEIIVGENNEGYAGIALDEDGNPVVVGTDFDGEGGGDILIAFLTPDGVETDRIVEDAFGELNEARAVAVAPGGEVSVIAVNNQPFEAFSQIDLYRFSGTTEVWHALPGEGAVPTALAIQPDLASLGGGGVAISTTRVAADGVRTLWLGRYAADGALSPTTYDPGESLDDRAGYVVADENGRITVSGTRPSVRGGLGVRDPVVVQVGPENAETWSWSEWTGATNLDLTPVGAAVDSVGRTAFAFQQGHGSTAGNHYALWVFEPGGELAWTTDTDGIDEDARFAEALVFDAADRLFVIGHVVPAGGSSVIPTRISVFDPQGALVCDASDSETGGLYADAVVDSAGDILAVGTDFDPQEDPRPVFTRFRGFD